MNSHALELALKKQRLVLQSSALRDDFAFHASGLEPACAVTDGVISSARWLRANPQTIVVVTVAFIVIKPKRAWHWARRAFSAWKTWTRLRTLLDRNSPVSA